LICQWRNKMNRTLRICVDEFEGAREDIGVIRALIYLSMVIVSTLVGLVIVLIVGALALLLVPLALAVTLVVMSLPRSERAKSGGVKQSEADAWLSE
jgi:hypothetical protein